MLVWLLFELGAREQEKQAHSWTKNECIGWMRWCIAVKPFTQHILWFCFVHICLTPISHTDTGEKSGFSGIQLYFIEINSFWFVNSNIIFQILQNHSLSTMLVFCNSVHFFLVSLACIHFCSLYFNTCFALSIPT